MAGTDEQKVKVFLCYAKEDLAMASRLYDDLRRAGIDPWMDRKNLLPGQNWKHAIKRAMKASYYVLALLSSHALSKAGYVQKELKDALEWLQHLPTSTIFLIPVRLDACEPEDEQLQEIQWVDLFESYDEGLRQILRVLCPTASKTPELSGDGAVLVNAPASSRRQDRATEYDLLSEKLARLRQARILETDAARLFKLDKQIEEAERQQAQLEEALEPSASEPPAKQVQPKQKLPKKKPEQQPPAQEPTKTTVIRLRSEPATVSTGKAEKAFGLTTRKFAWGTGWGPQTYITNQYEARGEVVMDHATGLMWQKSGSDAQLTYKATQAYIKELNDRKFAGYSDWRLPTIPELMSLLEPKSEPKRGRFLNPIFETPKDISWPWCWSADRLPKRESSSGAAWGVDFLIGFVNCYYLDDYHHVRGVRS